jgi:transmembrane sensor
MTRLQQLFTRYRNNDCSPQEESELFELLNKSDPEARMLLDELWNSPSQRLADSKSEEIVNSILESKNNVLPIQRKSILWLKAAAITAIIAVAGAGFYSLMQSEPEAAPHEVAQFANKSKFMKLPDGSKVILNSDSKLEFPKSFDNGKSREVVLTGEAYFDISHDESKPFIVRTGNLSTTVLGTAFNIKAYPNQSNITVTVTRGKVSVSNQAGVLGILSPDDQIIFDRNDRQTKVSTVNSSEVIAWTEKDIFFDNVSMAEAAEELSERFDVNIKFRDPGTMNCRFTATFIRGEDLHQILDVICEFNKADYAVSDAGVIEVSGNGCVVE